MTLEQADGPVRLERAPTRVYVVDNWSLDMMVALGVKPVGAATYFPPSPWLTGAPELQGVALTTVAESLPLEKIAAAKPDLIVEISGGADETGQRDRLRRIAPVLSSPKDGYTDGWRERLRHLGSALGRSTEADEAIAKGEATFQQIKEQHPKLAGAPVTFARFDPPASFAIVADDSDFTRRFLTNELGVSTPAAQVKAYREKSFSNVGGVIEDVSLERLDLLDAEAAAVDRAIN